ncbi:hypothetical protein H696_05681 [Fonticula alba]|uniref:Uncharacterized protein n=1 Tax=Fonticula alba TaxID=691883 RepID=A0A058Z140_FONAL|nr:hypothetical protein H696_05681 [Fonticula alba]KCV67955.1 hypothetical protein H696_05681 [Fonticula alba]|eukprot:XP_009497775.1 hypothetical protein H696_05681 [Fonticula alba]
MSTTATATAIPIPDLGQPASSEESPDYLETSPSSQSLVSAYSSAKLNDAPLYADAGAGPTPKTLPPVGMSLDSLSSIDTSSSQLEGGHSSDDHSVETRLRR